MRIEDAWRQRVGQLWRRQDRQDGFFPAAYNKGKQWGNFVVVSSKIHENTCTVVHSVVYVDGHHSTIVEHGGSDSDKEWSMDKDERFVRLL